MEKDEVCNDLVESKKSKLRDCNVDLIRIIACLIVISVHTNNLAVNCLDKTRIIWAIIFGDGVAIFFMLMGFFLFKNNSFKKLLKKTAINIILPSFVLLIFGEIFYPLISHKMSFNDWINNYKVDVKTIILNILRLTPTSNSGHLWYIFSYFKIILTFPILKMITESEKLTQYAVLLGFGTILYNDINVFFNPSFGFTNFGLFDTLIIFPLIGYEIYRRKDKIKENKKITLISILLIFIVEAIRFWLQYNMYKRNLSNNNYVFWNTSFGCIISILIILMGLSLKIKNAKVQKVISYIGERTFVIYLIHFLVVQYFNTTNLMNMLLDKLGYSFDNINEMTFMAEGIFTFSRVIIEFIFSLIIAILLHHGKKIIVNGYKKIFTPKTKKVLN